MALVYRFDLSKGSGPWCSGHYLNGNGYNPGPGHDRPFGTDPNYPHIVEAEAVKVTPSIGPNGENVMETDSSEGEDEIDAGIHISHQRLSLNKFTIVAVYQLTASAVADGLPFAPLFYLSNNFTFAYELLLAAEIDGSDIRMQVNARHGATVGTFLADTYSRPIASVPQDRYETFTVRGRNGILSGTSREANGYVQVSIDKTVIYNLQGIALDIGSGLPNGPQGPSDPNAIISDIGIGFSGMYGRLAYLEIYDDDGDTVNADKGSGPCCSTSGAPGGGTTSPDGTVNPTGPRQNTTYGVMGYDPFIGGGDLPQ